MAFKLALRPYLLPQSVYWAIGLNAGMPFPSSRDKHRIELTPSLSAEDHGSSFFLIFRGEQCDVTVSIEPDVAQQLAEFIRERRGRVAP